MELVVIIWLIIWFIIFYIFTTRHPLYIGGYNFMAGVFGAMGMMIPFLGLIIALRLSGYGDRRAIKLHSIYFAGLVALWLLTIFSHS